MARTVKRLPPTAGGQAPEPYKTGQGLARHRERPPLMHVTLDAGAFDWMWLELSAKLRTASQPGKLATFPEYHDLVSRAYSAFQAASTDVAETIANTQKTTPGRRVVRRAK